MATHILLRRDTAANWTTANPVLSLGEEGVETDTLRRKMGDGVTAWSGLAYSTALPADVTTAQAAAQSYADGKTTAEVIRADGKYLPAAGLDAATATNVATPASATAAALKAAYVAPLPTLGSFTYNPDGTIASDPDGNTYTWNADGTPATQTKGGVTRTFHWNTDGTLASVS